MEGISSALGVPRLDATTVIFSYFLDLDTSGSGWAEALIAQINDIDELKPLQVAALLECLHIF